MLNKNFENTNNFEIIKELLRLVGTIYLHRVKVSYRQIGEA
jgi:hypothetical protein